MAGRARLELQCLGDLAHDPFPVVELCLAEESRGRIPGTVGALGQPAPVRDIFQRNPHGPCQRACKMRDGRVRRDDEIEIGHDRGSIDEGIVALVEVESRPLDRHSRRQAEKLFAPVILLQTDDPYTVYLRERLEFAQGNRAAIVDAAGRIALPSEADLETLLAES